LTSKIDHVEIISTEVKYSSASLTVRYYELQPRKRVFDNIYITLGKWFSFLSHPVHCKQNVWVYNVVAFQDAKQDTIDLKIQWTVNTDNIKQVERHEIPKTDSTIMPSCFPVSNAQFYAYFERFSTTWWS